MDITKLSLTELRRLQSKIEIEIRRRSDSIRRELLKKVQKMAAEEGLSLNDILNDAAKSDKSATRKNGNTVKKAAKKPAKIKYRNPENTAIGWSGRGRKPQWILDWLGQGKSLEDLAV